MTVTCPVLIVASVHWWPRRECWLKWHRRSVSKQRAQEILAGKWKNIACGSVAAFIQPRHLDVEKLRIIEIMALFLILIFWLIPEQFVIKSHIEFVIPYRIRTVIISPWLMKHFYLRMGLILSICLRNRLERIYFFLQKQFWSTSKGSHIATILSVQISWR